jgi:hypothetical protein
MKTLLKYILIIGILAVLLSVILSVSSVLDKRFMEEEKAKLDIQREQGLLGDVPVAVPHGFYSKVYSLIWDIILYIIPILVALLSILYLVKKINGTRYLKSLLIPLSYIAITFISLIIADKFALNLSGESQMIWLFVLFGFGVTLASVLVINFIIYFVNLIKKRGE